MKLTCAICGETIDGLGHNAQPLADGKCCDACVHDVNVARIKARSSNDEYLPRVIEKLAEKRPLTNGETRV